MPCVPQDVDLELHATQGYRGDQVLDEEKDKLLASVLSANLSQSVYENSSLPQDDVRDADQVMIDHGYPPAHVSDLTYAELGTCVILSFLQ